MKQEEDSLQNTEQGELFQLEFTDYTPSSLGTVHLSGFAIASDEMEYAVKSVNSGITIPVVNPSQVPASEWFCTSLAELCGIATPVCKILKCLSSGEYVFGSRIELSAWKTGLNDVEWIGILTNASDGLKRQMWAIYAFDQFIHNIDRHFNNYLYMQNTLGNTIVKTFDFSLSSFVIGWPRGTGTTLPTDSTTYINWEFAKRILGDSSEFKASALNILDKIEKIGSSKISDILDSMPEQWMPSHHKEYLLRWWESEERKKRLDAIRQEINS
ncbi:hypothetical protein KWH83_16560 [Morganella morganii]|nr:hypothetical protein [Morganella morganii subsp. morganii]MCU6226125.1 hypothetical protein [Morganella morganii]MCU6232022.1 hypothetical protein [Morganella morganii]